MRKLLFLLGAMAALGLMALPASAGITINQIPAKGVLSYVLLPDGTLTPAQSGVTPLGYQQLTSLSAATGFTPPAGATHCIFQAEIQAVRWRDDGTNPTASVGFPLLVGVPFDYNGSLSAIKFIQQTASATVDVACYK